MGAGAEVHYLHHAGQLSCRDNKLFDDTLLRENMEYYFEMGGCDYLEDRRYYDPEVTLDDAVSGICSILDALSNGDYLYVRNLYETRRMQYTLMNLAGTNPETSANGKLKYGSKGTPNVRISLTIPDSAGAWSFWPWRDSELTKLFNSCPPGAYSVEALDLYKDGVYNHTEYRVYVT